MATSIEIIPPRVDFIDPRTGKIAREWFLFLLGLRQDTNGNGTAIGEIESLPVDLVGSRVDELASTVDGLGMAPTIDPSADILATIYPDSASTITVTASPFSYSNVSSRLADVIVAGGGVSNLEFSRGGVTFYPTGSFYGVFPLSPGDILRVTYTTAPTMTLIPR